MDDTLKIRTLNPAEPPAREPSPRGGRQANRGTPGGASSPLRRTGELTVLVLVLAPILLVLVGLSVVLIVLLMSLFLG